MTHCTRCFRAKKRPIGRLCDFCLGELHEAELPLPRATKGPVPKPRPETRASNVKYEPTTQKGPGWLARVAAVLVREQLDSWQIAERFGLTEEQAGNLLRHLRKPGGALFFRRRRAQRTGAPSGKMGTPGAPRNQGEHGGVRR